MDETATDLDAAPRFREISGRYVVMGMFTFAIVVVGAMWLYWELYTRPFRDVQAAIAKRFPESSPRVVGGRYKSHKPDSVATLRIICRINFNPDQNPDQALQRARELVQITTDFGTVVGYDVIEVVLMGIVPEKKTRVWFKSLPTTEWLTSPAKTSSSSSPRLKVRGAELARVPPTDGKAGPRMQKTWDRLPALPACLVFQRSDKIGSQPNNLSLNS